MADDRERRYGDFQVLGLVMDKGPQTLEEIIQGLYPKGTPGRKHKGQMVPKDPKSIQKKLDALLKEHWLRGAANGRYVVDPDIGRVWVIYVGSERGYVGVYDASLLPLPRSGSSGAELDVLEDIGEAKGLDLLQQVLNPCLDALADRVMDVDQKGRKPGALVIGLPAALSLDNSRVQGDAPEGWKSRTAWTIDQIVEKRWRSLQKRRRELPDLPRCADGRLALTADADVVLDTLGAMYDLTRVDVERPDPRRAQVLLGVKHSVGIRSTVIMRGPAELHFGHLHRRPPGQRRDIVYRGAFGDTIGLGHSIALIQRASRKTRELEDDSVSWEDSTQYHQQRNEQRRPCSCGTVDPPHLNQVASYDAVKERLENAGLDVGPDDVWEGIDRQIDEETESGNRARLMLQETGRLLAYALDDGVRLYDPEAIVVTGKMAFNNTFWNTVSETAEVGRTARRRLIRAADIPGDKVSRPIGPRGAAWLGFDTWVFPTLLSELDPGVDPVLRTLAALRR